MLAHSRAAMGSFDAKLLTALRECLQRLQHKHARLIERRRSQSAPTVFVAENGDLVAVCTVGKELAGKKVWEFVLQKFSEVCLPNDAQQACARGKVALNGERRQISKDAEVEEGDRVQYFKKRKISQKTKRLASSNGAQRTVRNNGARSGHKAPQRASRFVQWLVKTYGQDYLTGGVGVLDVAGGAGKVALELCGRCGVPCTVVDPRPVKWNAKQARLMEHRKDMFKDVISGNPEREAKWNHKFSAVEIANGTPLQPAQELCLFDESFLQTPRTSAMFEQCRLVIGMHPDEATDAIVKFSLQHRKPFAIVPCCVYWRLFPHRRTPTGKQVRSAEELNAYLISLAPDKILRAELDFPGRNTVLYTLPE